MKNKLRCGVGDDHQITKEVQDFHWNTQATDVEA